jgi:hypothetical protein
MAVAKATVSRRPVSCTLPQTWIIADELQSRMKKITRPGKGGYYKVLWAGFTDDNRASCPVLVNSKANASNMAIGQECDATNHPGAESFDGEIARFLIYERSLTDMELDAMMHALATRYSLVP